jgi:transposase
MQYIEPADRHQYEIMSTLDDLVRKDHPVRLIDEIIEEIVKNNSERFARKNRKEAGRPGYLDSTHLKLYLYGYFNGISSSRKLEIETHRNKEVIWLLGGLTPDHWTISNYRKENGEDIKFVTKKFREFLKDNGYIKLKTVAIDGTKVKANTNREMLTLKKIEVQLEGIDKKMEEYLKRIKENDEKDSIADEFDGEDGGNNSVKYIEKIIELQKKVEELQKCKEILEQTGQNYLSKADTDARLMKSRDGMIPAYNVQIVVDEENQLIADSEVVDKVTDHQLLPYMISSIKEELGKCPEEAIADKGYTSPDLIESIEDEETGLTIYAPLENTNRGKEKIKFIYDKNTDEYLCSAGNRLVLWQKDKKKNKSLTNVYRGIGCNGCSLREQCTKSKAGRIYHAYINQEWRDKYKERMSSKTSELKSKLRKALVEHPFGTIKYLMGKIPLKLRGKEKVSTEINLYTMAYNLKRLINLESFTNIDQKISIYEW